MIILNLTQHEATQEQLAAGVIEPRLDFKKYVQDLLTFESIPDSTELDDRAHDLALAASMYDIDPDDDESVTPRAVMLGGAPFFMSTLENWCQRCGLVTLYAFSRRESVDHVMPDGTFKKVGVFRHLGFVETLK